MGFSLVGNSGDQKTTTNVDARSFSQSINPQLDAEGAGPGAFQVNISPSAEAGNIGDITPDITSYYAPLTISSLGSGLGDQALAQFGSVSKANAAIANPTAATGSSLSDLFSGNSLYWILGALAILFLTHHK